MSEKQVNFKPIKGRILVKQETVPDVTESGIIIVRTEGKEKLSKGVIVAVSDQFQNDEGNYINLELLVGQTISFGEFSGVDIKIDEEDYLIMREQDVFGVFNNT